jgi:hypothetical protein
MGPASRSTAPSRFVIVGVFSMMIGHASPSSRRSPVDAREVLLLFCAQPLETLLDDVVDELAEERLALGLGEFRDDPGHELREDRAGLAFEQRPHRLGVVAPDVVDLAMDLGELLLKGLPLLAEVIELLVADLALLVEQLELLGGHRLVVDEGEDDGMPHRAGGKRHQGQARLRKRLLEGVEGAHDRLDLVLGVLVDLRLADADALRAEGPAQVVADEVRHLVHEAPEPPGLAPGQADQARAVRLREVVHVAAVPGLTGRGLELLEHAADERHPPRPHEAAHEDVLPRRPRFQAEPQRVDGRILADHAGGRLDLLGRAEDEALGLATPAQRLGAQGWGGGPVGFSLRHGPFLSASSSSMIASSETSSPAARSV